MTPLVIISVLLVSATAAPFPADDQLSQPSTQKRWIDEFTKAFQGSSKAPEKATTGPQVFDFKFGYDLVQSLLTKMLAAKPIVDGLPEKNKYGNDGSMHQFIGTVVVKGTEALSKMINAAFDVPKLAAKMVSNSITQALNGLGAKIIGL